MLLTSCDQSGEPNKPPYFVDETFIQVQDEVNEVFWLDERTLVFSGIDNGSLPSLTSTKLRSQVSFSELRSHIFIWKMGGEPRIHRKDLWSSDRNIALLHHLCAAKGRIEYSISPYRGGAHSMEWDGMAGSLGQEQPVHLKFITDDERWFPRWVGAINPSRIDRPCEQAYAPEMLGHIWRPSWKGDVIFDLGSTGDGDVARLEPLLVREIGTGRNIRVKNVFPIDVWPACSVAPMWNDTVVIWKCFDHAHTPVSKTISVWSIKTNGDSARTDLYFSNLLPVELYPFRNGYFAKIAGAQRQSGVFDPTFSGTYVLIGSKWKRILGPNFQFRAISPDGCLAVFAAQAHALPIVLNHLAVYDICKAVRS